MADPVVMGDARLDAVLSGDQPVLILLTNGEGLRGDFTTAFRKAVDEHPEILFARIDPTTNPQAAQRFDVGSKPVMVGWYMGNEILRRNRPWGSDVPAAIELLQAAVNERQGAAPLEQMETPVESNNKAKPVLVNDAPVAVTDDTFEAEVLASDVPVLVDFWAEWCGPCRMVGPILEKLAKEFAGKIKVAKVNVDENPGLSQYFRVMSIPTIMCVKQRTIVFSQPGALPEPAFRDLINQLIALEIPANKAAQPVQ